MLTATRKVFNTKSYRAFGLNGRQLLSSNRGIPSEEEQAGGRRKVELEEAKQGRIAFNQSSIIPDAKAGTKENPILVSVIF